MDGEEAIISLRPYRFVTCAVIAPAITIVGLIRYCVRLGSNRQTSIHYWLTNRRVIWCHGFIGYKVRSVPLERIADVVISRTLPELIAGISSIEIRDMTGQTGAVFGLGAKWIGVKEAAEVQKRILEQIREVNERTRKI